MPDTGERVGEGETLRARLPVEIPFPIRSNSASSCVMKRSAVSFHDQVSLKHRSPGIILPEGSDTFDTFRCAALKARSCEGLAGPAIPVQ